MSVAPRASAPVRTGAGEGWYEIRAAASGAPAEILIFEEIGAWGISARRLINDIADADLFSAAAVDIRIHSPGGSVLDGFAIFNTLRRLSGVVNIYIDGLAASMASVIAMLPGAQVHIPENAWVMIHNPWGGAWGDAAELREYADLLERHEKNIVNAYVNKTGIDAEEIKTLMAAETWLTGAEAVEKGFANVLLPEVEMAACINDNITKEFSHMPQAVQRFFKPRATGAQQQPAAQQPAQQPAEPPAAQQDAATIAAQAIEIMAARETERKTAVTAVFTNFPAFAALQNSCLADTSCTDTVARQRLLDELAQGAAPAGGAHIFAGNGNLVGDSIKNIIMSRAGYEKREADNRYSGMTLAELARASLTDRGVGVSGLGRLEVVGMAFTHSNGDFGNILMDVAHKSALAGWEDAGETFDVWTRKGELTDFKTAHRVGLDSFPALREVRPGAEYKYVTLSDTGATIALATYGELFSIDRQAIINDDLSMLTRIPHSMGAAAKSTIGDLVYALLVNNPKFGDKPLFHTDRGNFIDSPLSAAALATGRAMMKKQKNGSRHLNIRPAFLLVSTANESLADQIINSTSVPGAENNSGISNPVRGMSEIVAEPRFDDSNEQQWYLAAAQGRDTVEVAYLDGNDSPVIESTSGFTVDGVTMKVRIDAGVSPMDYRGLLKSTGDGRES
ncbi:ATP-dependent Clp protease proteolytic subunit [Salmonella enterica subsp. enterica serovar Abeokuta]|uniref:ATP-dependent Clp protease proteolytic subunit n=1 Tax=Salmonella enterica subsp. enterica serovar Abeokuta TaxID=2926665 RepID=A0A8T9IQ78_SALET|nr:ClpP-like prohead protease/major capsid protein fusion protein [Salmonella enterica]UNO36319.1 ATP-dependent Clp protease proteolytic subunit [Salmonella enterica subsp. enterica serovar Abeokuta]